jgi:hypothetical protein
MESIITMGNDEFILYIRKKTRKCSLSNDRLGKMIWIWILEKDIEAIQVEDDRPCLWGRSADNIDAKALPMTATQFEFKRSILPSLYVYLDVLGLK